MSAGVMKVSAETLRRRGLKQMKVAGDLIQSALSLAFTEAHMDCCDFVFAIETASKDNSFEAREITPPEKPLDPYTLAYMLERFRENIREALENTTFVELDVSDPPNQDEVVPPGVRTN